jgi:radical SAM enzyme (TIGR01210 family)
VVWPVSPVERDRFVIAHRPSRPAHDPWRPRGVLVEEEAGPEGRAVAVATIFLTGRECPWRCAMCDLWQYTIAEDTPPGAIPAQISDACREIADRGAQPTAIKLYNAGSFFDSRAVPDADYPAIARLMQRFERVIVECHPALVGGRIDRFLAALDEARAGAAPAPALEVAVGLETAHPDALEKLNKRMSVESFSRAAAYLAQRQVALRVFLLIAPPFVPADAQDEWLLRSVDVALACGASAISLIPTRAGNGTLDALEREGAFTRPSRAVIARSLDLAQARVGTHARVFLDPWSES